MTRHGAMLLLLACAALPLVAVCQAQLPPRLATIPAPAPVGKPFYAVVTMFGSPAAIGFYDDQFTIQGNSITARFDYGCGFSSCPGGSGGGYAGFPLLLPSLPAGAYQLTVVDSYFENPVGPLTLTIGGYDAPALTTHPSPPPANQPFDAELRIIAHPDDFGINSWFGNDEPQVDGNRVSFDFDDYTCASTSPCSNELTYRSFPLHFPALPAGTYDVQFNSYYLRQFILPAPLPPVVEFSLTIPAAPVNSIPATGFSNLLIGALGFIAIALPALRQHHARSLA